MNSSNKFNRILQRLWTESADDNFKRIKVRLGLNKFTEFDHHVWCLSTGRVGTQTISKLLSLDTSILCKHEPKPVLFGLSKEAYNLKSFNSNSIITEAILLARGNLKGLNQNMYVETSPHLTFLAPHLLEVFPNSKFVHVIRNPISVIDSGLKRKWYNGNAIDHWRIEPKKDDAFFNDWNHWSAVEKNIWSWAETNNWIDEFFKFLPSNRKLRLESEDLFAGEEKSINCLFEFIGVDIPEKQKIKTILQKKFNSTSSSFENSFKTSPENKELIKSIAGGTVQKFGY